MAGAANMMGDMKITETEETKTVTWYTLKKMPKFPGQMPRGQ